MSPLIKTIRALAIELIKRMYIPLVVAIIIGGIALVWVSLWLTTMSDWWWILAVFVIGFLLLLAFAITFVGVFMRIASPTQTKEQKRLTKSIVNKMQTLAEITSTPRFFLLFQVTRDAVAPRKDGFIASLGEDTTLLKAEFRQLRDSFSD